MSNTHIYTKNTTITSNPIFISYQYTFFDSISGHTIHHYNRKETLNDLSFGSRFVWLRLFFSHAHVSARLIALIRTNKKRVGDNTGLKPWNSLLILYIVDYYTTKKRQNKKCITFTVICRCHSLIAFCLAERKYK